MEMPRLVNVGLIRNPWNWIIVYLMVAIGVLGLSVVPHPLKTSDQE